MRKRTRWAETYASIIRPDWVGWCSGCYNIQGYRKLPLDVRALVHACPQVGHIHPLPNQEVALAAWVLGGVLAVVAAYMRYGYTVVLRDPAQE